jgi:hypothetical protein
MFPIFVGSVPRQMSPRPLQQGQRTNLKGTIKALAGARNEKVTATTEMMAMMPQET